MAGFARALVAVLLLLLVAAQNPKGKIGATLGRCGSSSDLIIRVDAALHWWANYTTTHGGIIINGTVHDVQFIRFEPFVSLILTTALAIMTQTIQS